MSLISSIKSRAKDINPYLVNTRHHLHANPELSFQEFETSQFIKSELSRIGIEFTSIADTGVVALIEGKNPSKSTMALRGDIDALPILEANQVDYKSKNKGVMHACGHDVHTTCLLGAAKILNDLKSEFEGTI